MLADGKQMATSWHTVLVFDNGYIIMFENDLTMVHNSSSWLVIDNNGLLIIMESLSELGQ